MAPGFSGIRQLVLRKIALREEKLWLYSRHVEKTVVLFVFVYLSRLTGPQKHICTQDMSRQAVIPHLFNTLCLCLSIHSHTNTHTHRHDPSCFSLRCLMRQLALRRAVNPTLTTFFVTVSLTKTAVRGDCFKAVMKGDGETN